MFKKNENLLIHGVIHYAVFIWLPCRHCKEKVFHIFHRLQVLTVESDIVGFVSFLFGLLDLLTLKILWCCSVFSQDRTYSFPINIFQQVVMTSIWLPKFFSFHGPRWLTQMHVQFSNFVFPLMNSSLWSWNQWRTIALNGY